MRGQAAAARAESERGCNVAPGGMSRDWLRAIVRYRARSMLAANMPMKASFQACAIIPGRTLRRQ